MKDQPLLLHYEYQCNSYVLHYMFSLIALSTFSGPADWAR